MKDVLVTVVSQRGFCANGHEVGQSFRCGGTTPEGVCGGAYTALYPQLMVLRSGGTLGWAAPDGSVEVACPDGDNPVVFRLKTVDEEA